MMFSLLVLGIQLLIVTIVATELSTNTSVGTTDSEVSTNAFSLETITDLISNISRPATQSNTTVSDARPTTPRHITSSGGHTQHLSTHKTNINGAFNVSAVPLGSSSARVNWHVPSSTLAIKQYVVLNYKDNCKNTELSDLKLDSKTILINLTISSVIIGNLSHVTKYCVCVVSISYSEKDISGVNNCNGFTTEYDHLNTKATVALSIASSFMVLFCITAIYNVVRSTRRLSRQAKDEELIPTVNHELSTNSDDDNIENP